MLVPIRCEDEPRSFPLLTLLIVSACVAAVALELGETWGYQPQQLMAHPEASAPKVVTSAFAHAGWMHLGCNMLFLFAMGRAVESRLGFVRFSLLYVGGMFAAAFTQAWAEPTASFTVVGASGAVAAVIGAYGSINPRGAVRAVHPIWPLWILTGIAPRLPVWFVVAGFFVANLLGAMGFQGLGEANIAFWSHLGGLLGGIVLGAVFSCGLVQPEERAEV